MSMFEVVYKKVTFFKAVCKLTFKIFALFCMHGQPIDSKSRSETTLRLISMPRIQWTSQIWKTSFY